ncbi:MAG: hypothetical protein ACLP4W_08260 [Mycobacterium sp.]|uniref:hypothetical protein n=1 Tax=Mycobacterium sp. TaxID=1785 RepID=UPI003F9BA0A9
MTTTTPSQVHQSNTVARRRQLRLIQLALAGAAAVGMLALFDAARPDSTQSVLDSASVRLADVAVPAPASGPVGPQLPQTPPNVSGGSLAADDNDNDNDQLQQQLDEQEQLNQQEIQQAQQQAEEQNEQAEQQFEQGMQQAQMDEQQANNP